jgi:hypothetical protein
MKNAVTTTSAMFLLLLLSTAARPADRSLPDQAKTILEKASESDVYSLEPLEKVDKAKALHGWKVLGKTTVKKAAARKALLTALTKGIAEPGRGGAKCFDPRHAIHATYEGKSVDLVICFECGWVYVYLDGNDKTSAELEVNGRTQPVFDKLLRAASIPLAKKRQK